MKKFLAIFALGIIVSWAGTPSTPANASILGFGTFEGTLVYDGYSDEPIGVIESCKISLRRQCGGSNTN